jgi:hypothetical protein
MTFRPSGPVSGSLSLRVCWTSPADVLVRDDMVSICSFSTDISEELKVGLRDSEMLC